MSRTTATLALLFIVGCGESPTDVTGDLTDSGTGPGSGTGTGTGTGTDTGTATADLTDGATEPTSEDPGATEPATTAEPTTGTATTATDTTTDTGSVTADCGFDPGLPFDRRGPIWQLVSDDGETCVLLERRDDSEPDVIYKAVPYTLLRFKIGHAGVVTEYTDLAQLSWESTHHNWLDVAEAWDTRVRYTLTDRYGQDFLDVFDLSAIDEQTNTSLWGPLLVHPYVP